MMEPLRKPSLPPDQPHPAELAAATGTPRTWRDSASRNYWAKLDPRDFAPFPVVKPLPYLEESRLFERAQNGDIDARNTLWSQHLRLAFSVVNRFQLPPSLLADAIQEAVIGLVVAIERFEVQRYLAFSTYAWYWMEQQVRRFRIDHQYGVRIPAYLFPAYGRFHKGLRRCRSRADWFDWREEWRSSHPKIFDRLSRFHRLAHPRPLDEAIDATCLSPHPASALEHDMLLEERVEKVLKTLTYREREIIKLRYGIGDGYTYTLEEVGTIFKITRARAQQVEAKAIRKLRHPVRSRMLEDFLEDAAGN